MARQCLAFTWDGISIIEIIPRKLLEAELLLQNMTLGEQIKSNYQGSNFH